MLRIQQVSYYGCIKKCCFIKFQSNTIYSKLEKKTTHKTDVVTIQLMMLMLLTFRISSSNNSKYTPKEQNNKRRQHLMNKLVSLNKNKKEQQQKSWHILRPAKYKQQHKLYKLTIANCSKLHLKQRNVKNRPFTTTKI